MRMCTPPKSSSDAAAHNSQFVKPANGDPPHYSSAGAVAETMIKRNCMENARRAFSAASFGYGRPTAALQLATLPQRRRRMRNAQPPRIVSNDEARLHKRMQM